MQLFNMSLPSGLILRRYMEWINSPYNPLRLIFGTRNPWKPYSNYINYMLNTYNPIVSFLREQHEKFEQPILHFAFHSDTPQGVALELVNEGVIDLRYAPDVEHMKYPGLAVMKDGKPKWGNVFPYEHVEGIPFGMMVPFRGEDYNFGAEERTINQSEFFSLGHIEVNMFKAVRNLSDAKNVTIPVPGCLVNRVVQLANERKHDQIIFELTRYHSIGR